METEIVNYYPLSLEIISILCIIVIFSHCRTQTETNQLTNQPKSQVKKSKKLTKEGGKKRWRVEAEVSEGLVGEE